MNTLVKIQGLLTSRIETRNKNHEIYYYGFFKLPNHEQEIPVVFKTKPSIFPNTLVELAGKWSQSNGSRPSFTCSDYKLLKEPEPVTLKSLQKLLQPLLNTCLEKKQEWTQRTDFFFRKKRDLEEIERMEKLGDHYLKAYLLTKQAFYANYQTEHLEQANFNLETYLQRIASELERESQHIQAYLKKEVK